MFQSPLQESDEELEAGDLCTSAVLPFRRSGTVREVRRTTTPDWDDQQDLSEARPPLRFQVRGIGVKKDRFESCSNASHLQTCSPFVFKVK